MLSKIIRAFASRKPTQNIETAPAQMLESIFEHLGLRMRAARLCEEDRPRLEALEKYLSAPPRAGEARRWRRAPMSVPARLSRACEGHDTEVLDASAGGFRIRTIEGLACGAPVRLEVAMEDGESYTFSCSVQWVDSSSGVAGLHLNGIPCPNRRRFLAAATPEFWTSARPAQT